MANESTDDDKENSRA